MDYLLGIPCYVIQVEVFEYDICNTKYVVCETPLSQRCCVSGPFYSNGIEIFRHVLSDFTLWLEN